MVWEAHTPHDSTQKTFFGFCKDDGFVKKKIVDAFNKWQNIEKLWLGLYHNKKVKDGLSAYECVIDTDEWLCEAYMKTDYSKLSDDNFQETINDYLAYLVRNGDVYEN